MTRYRVEERARLKRRRTAEAVTLAMQSRWEEAVIVNRNIIEVSPTDKDAYNRLGKALTELGRYAEAKEAYHRALSIDPSNRIARKNFERLSQMKKEVRLLPKARYKVDPRLFIEKTGKTGLVNLYRLAPKEVLMTMAPGDRVRLRMRGRSLIVEDISGVYLGEVEPKLGLRLAKLMAGGNRYEAVLATLQEGEGKAIIKEVFQDPSQAGQRSFLPRAADGFRSYIKESLLKYELEDEEELVGEREHSTEWKEEIEPSSEDIALFSDVSAEDENDDELGQELASKVV